ncbi:hypothetical protein OH76DRAFT_1479973 [Lentinus brumalis]|uniref:Uncharacterized protein n=1 Tax=Lentinus brumalis TaxID=2498619 RepID=A0A371DM25_9APHY|nr:hypothetical protein OH76DRAFT_1479973 [Polyporus brumalis]
MPAGLIAKISDNNYKEAHTVVDVRRARCPSSRHRRLAVVEFAIFVSTAVFCATLCFMNTPIRYPQQGLETYDRPGGGPARHNHRSTHRSGAAPYQQRSRPLSPSGGGSPLLTGMNNFPTPTSGDYLSPLAPQSRGPRQSPDVLFTQQQPPQPNPAEEQDPMDALYPAISYSTTAPMVPAPPGPPSPATPSGFTPSELEGLIERYKVQSLRNKVYAFPQMSLDNKLTLMFLQQLRIETQFSAISGVLAQTETRLAHLEKLCELAWTPNKSQMKILRALVRHYLVKVLPTYTSLGGYVKTYIHNNADVLHMSFYATDPTIRTTINGLCGELASQMKSSFRKALFKAVQNKVPLVTFAKNMYNSYHLVPVPKDVPTAMLATFALMRQVADPLAKKKNTAGSDTGFWKALEASQDALYKKHSPDKDRVNGPAWQEWATAIIAKDKRKWPSREDDGVLIPGAVQEIDAALGIARGDDNDVGISGANADESMQQTVPEEPEPEEEREDDEDDEDDDDTPINADLGTELARRAEEQQLVASSE